jgi:hypothetical protein
MKNLRRTFQTLFIVIVLFPFISKSYAQNIFPTTGNVGIGTNTPSTSLHIQAKTFSWGSGKKVDPFHLDYYKFSCETCFPHHTPAIVVKWTGNIGIHTNSPQEKFHINSNTLIEGDLIIKGDNTSTVGNNEVKITSQGYIRARDILVDFEEIPDYVFSNNYNLMPLSELKQFIEKNQHLPNIKSQTEFNNQGNLSVSEMNIKLLEKVEELTLYILQLDEQINNLKN